jgi:predicted RNA-binding protein with PUA-like domain
MGYWLVKSDPDSYGWDELKRDKKTDWDGVRNYQARNNLRLMKNDDEVLFYHSQSDKAIIGITTVTKEAYQDPTTDDDRWVAVELKYKKELKTPVTLKQIKCEDSLSEVALIRHTRLSVMPIEEDEFNKIVALGK